MSKLLDILKRYELWLLRVAVVFPMLWAGIGGLANPQNWIGYLPDFIWNPVTRSFLLMGHSVLLIATAILLMSGPWRWFFALMAFGNLAGILIFYGLDDITFRDVGLAIVALVLFAKEYESSHLSSVG